MASEIDLLVLGHRVRYFRRQKGLTLTELGELVGRPAPYLSQLENGRVEAKLGLLGSMAAQLGVTTSELLVDEAPDERSRLEIEFHRAQNSPEYRELGLEPIRISAKIPDEVLKHLLAVWESRASATVTGEPGGAFEHDRARIANNELRAEMRDQDNFFPEIEQIAQTALDAAGYIGHGPISERVITDLAAYFGFTIERVSSMPRTARSITDTRDKIVFIPDRGDLKIRQARSVVMQTLGHFALEHRDTTDFGSYLRQRIESNYFAAAILAPLRPAIDFLADAKAAKDISVEDLKETFYISYEMAAHRFTNLATAHLGLPVHFVRTDAEGVINKAYENDGLVFPVASDGALEGQRVPRQWGARQAWQSSDTFLLHSQHTVTDNGDFFCVTYIETETDRSPHAITLGTTADHSKCFRGSDTLRREFARSQEIEPDPDLAGIWSEVAWPSAGERSHVLTAMPPAGREFSPFPGIDLHDVYRFLDRQARHRKG